MASGEWKGYVNGILYGIQFDRTLDDAAVDRVADGVLHGLYPGDRAQTTAALNEALRHEGPLNDEIEAPHTEESIRVFLGRLSAALAARG